jgi:hypothetical protein
MGLSQKYTFSAVKNGNYRHSYGKPADRREKERESAGISYPKGLTAYIYGSILLKYGELSKSADHTVVNDVLTVTYSGGCTTTFHRSDAD